MTNHRRLPSGRVIDMDAIVDFDPQLKDPSLVYRGTAPDDATPGFEMQDWRAIAAWAASVPALYSPAVTTAPGEGPFKVGDRVSFEYVRGDGDRVGVVRFIDPEDDSLFVCVPGRRGPSQAEGVRGTGWWMMAWEFDRVDKVTP